mmetsp:Transcript_55198/g.148877  ORF Transcript_55198/g.148877 Transcript_55198/m.148877 type:complete len:208 (-) Transcript_55198:826-1449(-)
MRPALGGHRHGGGAMCMRSHRARVNSAATRHWDLDAILTRATSPGVTNGCLSCPRGTSRISTSSLPAAPPAALCTGRAELDSSRGGRPLGRRCGSSSGRRHSSERRRSSAAPRRPSRRMRSASICCARSWADKFSAPVGLMASLSSSRRRRSASRRPRSASRRARCSAWAAPSSSASSSAAFLLSSLIWKARLALGCGASGAACSAV